MRRFAWILILVGVLLAVAVPAWAEPPAGFADLPWGTPSNKVYEYTRAQNLCTLLAVAVNRMQCEPYTLPGVGQGTVHFFLLIPAEPDPRRYTLAGYVLDFPHSAYAAFRRVVVEKYGAPHRQEAGTYTTGAGATLPGEILAWRWPDVSARLLERCGTVTRICLDVTTPELEAQEAERDRREREKAKRSF
jgi:hypothetical protein